MHKIITLIFLMFLFSLTVGANKIDSLRSDEDVVAFLKMIDENFRSEKYNKIDLRSTEMLRKEMSCNGIAEQWQVNNWEKTDFNQDGLTDLLVILYWYDYGVYAVIDKGNNNFRLETLTYNIYKKCELAKPVKLNDEQLLLIYQEKTSGGTGGQPVKMVYETDTLIYKYGGFVEYNKLHPEHKIDSIQFRTGFCFGSCPVFTIRFDKTGNAEYDAGSYNPKQGKFTTTLKKENLDRILGLVNYMNVKSLQDNYRVPWTDDQTSWLKIKFTDGSIKEIQDYGLRGSFGLRLLYNIFFDLRSSESWK